MSYILLQSPSTDFVDRDDATWPFNSHLPTSQSNYSTIGTTFPNTHEPLPPWMRESNYNQPIPCDVMINHKCDENQKLATLSMVNQDEDKSPSHTRRKRNLAQKAAHRKAEKEYRKNRSRLLGRLREVCDLPPSFSERLILEGAIECIDSLKGGVQIQKPEGERSAFDRRQQNEHDQLSEAYIPWISDGPQLGQFEIGGQQGGLHETPPPYIHAGAWSGSSSFRYYNTREPTFPLFDELY